MLSKKGAYIAIGAVVPFLVLVIAGVSGSSSVPAVPAGAPSYCGTKATERLPECGWTAAKDKAPIQKAREENQKPTEAEVREMARIYTNCMKTDTSEDRCAAKAGIPPGVLR